ncbi:MAG: J domain-containing protein, partial [Abditibacteriota bacterium]|nr:J domain-containing protein [Abditibacteriota bacterium]
DLYARINVRRHPRFVRQGNDLICDMEISFPCAALGGNVNVETFDGPVPLNIAAGTQYGEIYTLKGKGMPNPADPKTVGNLNVRIKIKTPTDLKDKEKKLLEDFAQSRGEEIKPHKGKNIFKRVKDAFK